MAIRAAELELHHPSTLTESQKKLVEYFYETFAITRVRERVVDQSGNLTTQEVEDNIRLLSFVNTDNRHRRFAGVEHISVPEKHLQPVYLSMRGLDESGIRLVAEEMAQSKLPVRPDFCTGVPKTGSKLMEEYAKITGLPFIDLLEKDSLGNIVRKLPHIRGVKEISLLGDDVISTGLSKQPAINVIYDSNFRLGTVLVFVDRRKFSEGLLPYNLVSSFHIVQAVHHLATIDAISASTFYESKNYFLRNPISNHQ